MYWLRPRRLFRFTSGTGIHVFATLSEDFKWSLHLVSMTVQAVQIRAHIRRHTVVRVHMDAITFSHSTILLHKHFKTTAKLLYALLPLRRDRTHSTFPKRLYHEQRQPRNLHNRNNFPSNVALGQVTLRIHWLSPVSMDSPMFHAHILFIYHRRYIYESVVKQNAPPPLIRCSKTSGVATASRNNSMTEIKNVLQATTRTIRLWVTTSMNKCGLITYCSISTICQIYC